MTFDPLQWAKERKPAPAPQRRSWERHQGRPPVRLDANELGKFIATLRRRKALGLRDVAAVLAAVDDHRQPLSPFGWRSGGNYLRRYQALKDQVVDATPPDAEEVEALRAMRWLARLLAIENAEARARRSACPSLRDWLDDDTPVADSQPEARRTR